MTGTSVLAEAARGRIDARAAIRMVRVTTAHKAARGEIFTREIMNR